MNGPFSAPSGKSRTRPHGNLGALRVAVVVLFAILTAQLARMQILDGDAYSQRSKENHVTQRFTLPPRGLIYDRNGEPLVRNDPVYHAIIVPEFLPPKRADRDAIFLRLESLLGVPAFEIEAKVTERERAKQGYLQVNVKRYLTKEEALRLDEISADMPGVSLLERPGRSYPAGPEFSQILGFIGEQDVDDYAELRTQGYQLDEAIGKAGVEATYERDLRGQRGVVAAEQDAQGHLVRSITSRDPLPGNSLRLSIDADLQRYVAETLRAAMPDVKAENNATTAAAVVMNPKTGAVYAIVSIPDYDNNLYIRADLHEGELEALSADPRRPLLNQALTPSAPGSTFKLVTASAGLQEGTVKQGDGMCINSTSMDLKGQNNVVYSFIDWTTHGCINLVGAISRSSNIYMYRIACGILPETIGYQPARGLGKDSDEGAVILGYYARSFGFGKPTGIDIGGEGSPGTIPSPEWKRDVYSGPEYTENDRLWVYGDTCFMGIGQGNVSASPLQVARMTSAVANGGWLVTPHVVDAVVDGKGNVVRAITTDREKVPVSEANLAIVRAGMHESVLGGAGALAYINGLDIAGKTGTAEFFLPSGKKAQHAWFTGYAPFNDPEVVVTVFFDLGIGGEKAAPVAGKILEYFMASVER
ncbi:MAG: penicillin-binding protein 2 [Dehalococcoidia bacterium]